MGGRGLALFSGFWPGLGKLQLRGYAMWNWGFTKETGTFFTNRANYSIKPSFVPFATATTLSQPWATAGAIISSLGFLATLHLLAYIRVNEVGSWHSLQFERWYVLALKAFHRLLSFPNYQLNQFCGEQDALVVSHAEVHSGCQLCWRHKPLHTVSQAKLLKSCSY